MFRQAMLVQHVFSRWQQIASRERAELDGRELLEEDPDRVEDGAHATTLDRATAGRRRPSP